MGLVTLSFFAAICFIGATHGIRKCSVGGETDGNLLERIGQIATQYCPIPYIHKSNEVYCCDNGCCNLTEYMLTGYRLIIIVVVILVIGIALIASCCAYFMRRRSSASGKH